MPEAVAVGDHVTLVFPVPNDGSDPDVTDDPVLVAHNALVVSAPDPAAWEAYENRDKKRDTDDEYPRLNLVIVDPGSPHDRYGNTTSSYTSVPHEDDYEPDQTGSAGSPAPYWN